MTTIPQTSTMYPTEACLSYDRVFRDQTDVKHHFNWAGDNIRLCNETFSGRTAPKPVVTVTPPLVKASSFPVSHHGFPQPRLSPSKPHRRMDNCAWASMMLPCFCLCKATLLIPCHLPDALLQCPRALDFWKGNFPNPSQTSRDTRPSTKH